MRPSVLILTPDAEIGKWIEQALDAPRSITALVATSADSALQLVQRQMFDLLILDTDLDGISLGELVATLRRRLPDLSVSILPPEKEGTALPLLGFTPDGYLTRPPNPQEILEQVRELTSLPSAENQELDEALVELFSEIPPPDPLTAGATTSQPPQAVIQVSTAPTWARDPGVAAKVLEYLHMKTGALGSFVILSGKSYWYTQQLTIEDRQDVESWSQDMFLENISENSGDSSETIGFVQLPSSSQDCQVFLTPLETGNLLGLVFGSEVPFRKVRSQVTQLVRTLIESRKVNQLNKPVSIHMAPPQSFSVVLTPRQAHQKLTGKISASISEWIQQIAASLGWQIVHLAVRPDHVLWISTVPAQTSLENQVSIVRQYTSLRLKQIFPESMMDNPEGDFWASDMLIRDSIQPPAAQELRLYLQGIRRQPKSENNA